MHRPVGLVLFLLSLVLRPCHLQLDRVEDKRNERGLDAGQNELRNDVLRALYGRLPAATTSSAASVSPSPAPSASRSAPLPAPRQEKQYPHRNLSLLGQGGDVGDAGKEGLSVKKVPAADISSAKNDMIKLLAKQQSQFEKHMTALPCTNQRYAASVAFVYLFYLLVTSTLSLTQLARMEIDMPHQYHHYQCKLSKLVQQYKRYRTESTKKCLDDLIKEIENYKTHMHGEENYVQRYIEGAMVATAGICGTSRYFGNLATVKNCLVPDLRLPLVDYIPKLPPLLQGMMEQVMGVVNEKLDGPSTLSDTNFCGTPAEGDPKWSPMRDAILNQVDECCFVHALSRGKLTWSSGVTGGMVGLPRTSCEADKELFVCLKRATSGPRKAALQMYFGGTACIDGAGVVHKHLGSPTASVRIPMKIAGEPFCEPGKTYSTPDGGQVDCQKWQTGCPQAHARLVAERSRRGDSTELETCQEISVDSDGEPVSVPKVRPCVDPDSPTC